MTILFGGSFFPPHEGHRLVIKFLQNTYPEAMIVLVPNFQSPLKSQKKEILPEQMIKLCELEFETVLNPRTILWDWELQSHKESYTVFTIQEWKEKHPEDTIYFAMGEDQLLHFKQWHKYDTILDQVSSLLILRRFTPHPKTIEHSLPSQKVTLLNNPLWPFASSEIRSNWNHKRKNMVQKAADYFDKLRK